MKNCGEDREGTVRADSSAIPRGSNPADSTIYAPRESIGNPQNESAVTPRAPMAVLFSVANA
jgi:hypothetical protein